VGEEVEEHIGEVGHQFWGLEEGGAHWRWLLHCGATRQWGLIDWGEGDEGPKAAPELLGRCVALVRRSLRWRLDQRVAGGGCPQ
jgi:hypothetical protein